MEQKYAASTDKVFELLTNGKWLEERCKAMNEENVSCKAKKAAGGVSILMKRRVTRELPALLAKVLSPTSDLEFDEKWAPDGDGYTGSFTMTAAGKPVKVFAEFSLRPAGKGCVYTIEHTCKASVPFIGAALEKFVLGQTQQGAKDELDYLTAYLKKNK